MSSDFSLLKAAIVTGAHGIKGQFRVKALLENPQDLASYQLHDGTGSALYSLRIVGASKGQLLCTLEHVRSRNAAEALKGMELFIHAKDLPEKEDGDYFWHELEGMRVVNTQGEKLGTVTGLHNYGAGDILEITLSNGEVEMFPFNNACFPMLDEENDALTFIPPEVV